MGNIVDFRHSFLYLNHTDHRSHNCKGIRWPTGSLRPRVGLERFSCGQEFDHWRKWDLHKRRFTLDVEMELPGLFGLRWRSELPFQGQLVQVGQYLFSESKHYQSNFSRTIVWPSPLSLLVFSRRDFFGIKIMFRHSDRMWDLSVLLEMTMMEGDPSTRKTRSGWR